MPGSCHRVTSWENGVLVGVAFVVAVPVGVGVNGAGVTVAGTGVAVPLAFGVAVGTTLVGLSASCAGCRMSGVK